MRGRVMRFKPSKASMFAVLSAAVLVGVLVVTTVGVGHDGGLPNRSDTAHHSLVPVDTSNIGGSDGASIGAAPGGDGPTPSADPDDRAATGDESSTTVPSDPTCGLGCTSPALGADTAVIPDDLAPPVHHPVPMPTPPTPGAATAGSAQPEFHQPPT